MKKRSVASSAQGQTARLRICIAASPGGHLVQAKCLASVYEEHDHFYFTFSGPVAEQMKKVAHVRSIANITRRNPMSWVRGMVQSMFVALAERPDIVISTGASVVTFFCIFAKLCGARLIFLESMAKVEKPTMTARLLYPFSDLFIVQWPSLLKFFPRAKFVGRLF